MDNLVFQIQQDSEYAFKQLYQIYYAKVVSFITGIIKERDIAKDWHKTYLSIYGSTGKSWIYPETSKTIFLLHPVMRQ